MRSTGLATVLFLIGAVVASCTPKQNAPTDLVQRGKEVYVANCIACHHIDPAQTGTVGPAIKGSSLALLKARIVSAGYPEGYKPQRETRVMPALPHLEPEIPAIHAFLEK